MARLSCGPNWLRFPAAHGLHELEVHLVRDKHYVPKQLVVVEFALMTLQCLKCDHLE